MAGFGKNAIIAIYGLVTPALAQEQTDNFNVSAKHGIFAPNLHDIGMMSDRDFANYTDLFDHSEFIS